MSIPNRIETKSLITTLNYRVIYNGLILIKRWPVVGQRLHQEFPYIEAEVKYACKEYARSAVDVLARRTRMSFLNVLAADEALPRIVELMGNELNWSKQKRQEEIEHGKEFLKREMGLNLKYQMKSNVSINFNKEEISTYIKRFRSLDTSNKGYITHKDLKNFFKVTNFIQLFQFNRPDMFTHI